MTGEAEESDNLQHFFHAVLPHFLILNHYSYFIKALFFTTLSKPIICENWIKKSTKIFFVGKSTKWICGEIWEGAVMVPLGLRIQLLRVYRATERSNHRREGYRYSLLYPHGFDQSQASWSDFSPIRARQRQNSSIWHVILGQSSVKLFSLILFLWIRPCQGSIMIHTAYTVCTRSLFPLYLLGHTVHKMSLHHVPKLCEYRFYWTQNISDI